jgi:hypothetical protein
VVSSGSDLRAASDAAWQELQRADARPRLAARCAVAVGCAAAHSTQRAPEMRLEPRIAPGGGTSSELWSTVVLRVGQTTAPLP